MRTATSFLLCSLAALLFSPFSTSAQESRSGRPKVISRLLPDTSRQATSPQRPAEPAAIRSIDTAGIAAARLERRWQIESVQDRTMDYDMSVGNIVVRGDGGVVQRIGLNATVRPDGNIFVPWFTIDSEEFIVPAGGSIELEYRLRVVGPTSPEDLRILNPTDVELNPAGISIGGITLLLHVKAIDDTSRSSLLQIGGKGARVNGTQAESVTADRLSRDIGKLAGRRVQVVANLYFDYPSWMERWGVATVRATPMSAGHYGTVGIARPKGDAVNRTPSAKTEADPTAPVVR